MVPFNNPGMQCFPVEGRKRKYKKASLPSVEIKENLIPCDIVLKKYPSLHQENVIGKLVVKLARDCLFGSDILSKCTVMRYCDYPYELKQAIFSVFPKYWQNQIQFESKIWSTCVNSIGQLCDYEIIKVL